jgi:SOS-response transcriptional repressor LexA
MLQASLQSRSGTENGKSTSETPKNILDCEAIASPLADRYNFSMQTSVKRFSMNQIQETPLSKELVLISGVTKRLDVELPLFLSPVTAGFPSPADDFLEKRLDLNEYLVKNPAATYLVRASGDSMQGGGHP